MIDSAGPRKAAAYAGPRRHPLRIGLWKTSSGESAAAIAESSPLVIALAKRSVIATGPPFGWD